MIFPVSELYQSRTGKNCLYNIMPIDNIPSVLKRGILCYDAALRDDPNHVSISMDEVQRRRDRVILPNGVRLHQYANLYFAYNNPMLYKRKAQAAELCVLAVSIHVLDLEGCVVSDQNAASNYVRFFEPQEGVREIDFQKIHAQYWTHADDPYKEKQHKLIKCAEVLVPHCIPQSYIMGAYVVNGRAESRLAERGFSKQILVRPRVFYR